MPAVNRRPDADIRHRFVSLSADLGPGGVYPVSRDRSGKADIGMLAVGNPRRLPKSTAGNHNAADAVWPAQQAGGLRQVAIADQGADP